MHTISKKIEFDYGHRVWSQQLNKDFSIDDKLVCRHLHGHRGSIEVFLEAENLNHGMVTDFKHLNWFKQWLDDTIDHKFILDAADPLINTFLPNSNTYGFVDKGTHWVVNTSSIKDSTLLEYFDSFVVVKFVPTSENLAKWMYDIIDEKMIELGVTTKKVIFKETPKTQSTYEP